MKPLPWLRRAHMLRPGDLFHGSMTPKVMKRPRMLYLILRIDGFVANNTDYLKITYFDPTETRTHELTLALDRDVEIVQRLR